MTDTTAAPEDTIEHSLDQGTLKAMLAVRDWHAHGVEQINVMMEHAREGVTLCLGEDPVGDPTKVVLTEEMAKGFKIGMIVSLAQLGTLPFTLSRDGEEVRDAEFEEVTE